MQPRGYMFDVCMIQVCPYTYEYFFDIPEGSARRVRQVLVMRKSLKKMV